MNTLFCRFLIIIFCLSSIKTFGAEKNNIDFEKYTLENGLTVILHQDNSSPVVATNIMYHVGSKNEMPDRTGFAHFFEHLMFEGSEHIDRGEIFKLSQNAGGKVNAYTTFDKTSYFFIFPSNQLKLALWIESERLRSLKIDSTGVETQRKVVKEERKMRYENQPYGSVIAEMFSRAFTEHPYKWVPIGEVQYIDQAKTEEFIAFHNQFYVPENAVLAIAGDIDIVKTKEWIDFYFSDISSSEGEIYRPNVKEPEIKSAIRDTIYDNIQLPGIFIGYHMPAEGTKDYYALKMLQQLISGGESSRLYKSLVDDKQLALQVSAFPYGLEDAGLFIAYSLANFGVDLKDVENEMDNEIEKVKQEGLTDREFKKLKNQTESAFVSSNSTMHGVAENLCNYEMFYDNPNLINTELERYMAVTKEDIQQVAQKYLSQNNRVVLYYLPK